MKSKAKRTLEELREAIDEQVDWVGIKPYSHNIIGLILSQIDDEFGEGEAKKAIIDFGLDKKGWGKP